jgi:hypothetical protein
LYKLIAPTVLLSFAIIWSLYYVKIFTLSLDVTAMARWKFWSATTAAVLALPLSSGLQVLDLSKAAWTVGNEALNISVPGSLPSVVCLTQLLIISYWR